jgi:hypothetical protein
MLDGIGLAAALGIDTTASLFGDNSHLLHSTSAVRYPAFYAGRNYTGHTPKMLRSPVLQAFVDDVLGPELRQVPDALIVPSGDAVETALRHLASTGVVDAGRCLFGFPHASPGNGWRERFYRDRRTELTDRVAKHFG